MPIQYATKYWMKGNQREILPQLHPWPWWLNFADSHPMFNEIKIVCIQRFFLFAFFLFFFSFFWFVVCMVECKQIEVRLSNQLMLTPNHPPFIWTTLETNTEKLLHWSNHNSCSRLKNTGCNPFFLFFFGSHSIFSIYRRLSTVKNQRPFSPLFVLLFCKQKKTQSPSQLINY